MKLQHFLITASLILASSLWAQNKQPPKNPNTQEKTVKIPQGRTSTNVDFGSVSIEGMVRNPFLEQIQTNNANRGGSFIHIRKNWHDFLVMSASGLAP